MSSSPAIICRQTALSSCYCSRAPDVRSPRRVAFPSSCSGTRVRRLKREAASMANLPDAWVEDARNLDNAEHHDAFQYLIDKYVAVASQGCPSLAEKRLTPHVLRHTLAMDLLHHGVDRSVIALWLGAVE